MGTDGSTYHAVFSTVSACTNFTYGTIDLAANHAASGCVVFALPTAVTVASIGFSLAPGYLDTAQWTNP